MKREQELAWIPLGGGSQQHFPTGKSLELVLVSAIFDCGCGRPFVLTCVVANIQCVTSLGVPRSAVSRVSRETVLWEVLVLGMVDPRVRLTVCCFLDILLLALARVSKRIPERHHSFSLPPAEDRLLALHTRGVRATIDVHLWCDTEAKRMELSNVSLSEFVRAEEWSTRWARHHRVHGTRPFSSHARNLRYLLAMITFIFKHYRKVAFRKGSRPFPHHLDGSVSYGGRTPSPRRRRPCSGNRDYSWKTWIIIANASGVPSLPFRERFDAYWPHIRQGSITHHRHFWEGHDGEHIVKEYLRACRPSIGPAA